MGMKERERLQKTSPVTAVCSASWWTRWTVASAVTRSLAGRCDGRLLTHPSRQGDSTRHALNDASSSRVTKTFHFSEVILLSGFQRLFFKGFESLLPHTQPPGWINQSCLVHRDANAFSLGWRHTWPFEHPEVWKNVYIWEEDSSGMSEALPFFETPMSLRPDWMLCFSSVIPPVSFPVWGVIWWSISMVTTLTPGLSHP